MKSWPQSIFAKREEWVQQKCRLWCCFLCCSCTQFSSWTYSVHEVSGRLFQNFRAVLHIRCDWWGVDHFST